MSKIQKPQKHPLLVLDNVTRFFHVGREKIHVLDKANLEIHKGRHIAILGPSGSGKSTLLYLLGLLDKPNSGEILLKGENVHKLSDNARSDLRNSTFGFVYQFHHLLPEFTALENVLMPAMIAKKAGKEAVARAKDLLSQVELSQRMNHYPSQLSGGEQQRVALARALMNKPDILLADEPTGSLDQKTSKTIMALIDKVATEHNLTLVLVTHNPQLAKQCDACYQMENGVLTAQ